MTVDAKRTHETCWQGELSSTQVAEMLIEGLRSELATPSSGMSLAVSIGEVDERGVPSFSFQLVHDHEWYAKRDLNQVGVET